METGLGKVFNPDDPKEVRKKREQVRKSEVEVLEERFAIQDADKPEEVITIAKEIPECAKKLLKRFKGEMEGEK